LIQSIVSNPFVLSSSKQSWVLRTLRLAQGERRRTEQVIIRAFNFMGHPRDQK
jgi:hypothetical protein